MTYDTLTLTTIAHEASTHWQPTPSTWAALRDLLERYGLGAVLRLAYEDGFVDGVKATEEEEW